MATAAQAPTSPLRPPRRRRRRRPPAARPSSSSGPPRRRRPPASPPRPPCLRRRAGGRSPRRRRTGRCRGSSSSCSRSRPRATPRPARSWGCSAPSRSACSCRASCTRSTRPPRLRPPPTAAPARRRPRSWRRPRARWARHLRLAPQASPTPTTRLCSITRRPGRRPRAAPAPAPRRRGARSPPMRGRRAAWTASRQWPPRPRRRSARSGRAAADGGPSIRPGAPRPEPRPWAPAEAGSACRPAAIVPDRSAAPPLPPHCLLAAHHSSAHTKPPRPCAPLERAGRGPGGRRARWAHQGPGPPLPPRAAPTSLTPPHAQPKRQDGTRPQPTPRTPRPAQPTPAWVMQCHCARRLMPPGT
jgi:hypothetical protein